jgi:hypothetical protein
LYFSFVSIDPSTTLPHENTGEKNDSDEHRLEITSSPAMVNYSDLLSTQFVQNLSSDVTVERTEWDASTVIWEDGHKTYIKKTPEAFEMPEKSDAHYANETLQVTEGAANEAEAALRSDVPEVEKLVNAGELQFPFSRLWVIEFFDSLARRPVHNGIFAGVWVPAAVGGHAPKAQCASASGEA